MGGVISCDLIGTHFIFSYTVNACVRLVIIILTILVIVHGEQHR